MVHTKLLYISRKFQAITMLQAVKSNMKLVCYAQKDVILKSLDVMSEQFRITYNYRINPFILYTQYVTGILEMTAFPILHCLNKIGSNTAKTNGRLFTK